jgi:hypothetical protein
MRTSLLVAGLVCVGALVVAAGGCGGDDSADAAAAGSAGGGGVAKAPGGAGGATSAAGGSSPAGASGGTLVDPGGLGCDGYKKLAGDHAAFLDYLSGPAYAAFHPDDGSTRPTLYDRKNDGAYCFGDCMKPPADWSGFGGQVLHTGGPGVSRVRFNWSRNEGHAGTKFAHLYLLRPIDKPDDADPDSWFTSAIDPAVDVDAWKKASGGNQLSEPIAIGRGKIAWSNNGIIAFRSGLVGAVGTGNSGDAFPFVQLGAGKIPSDVAVTNSNEFALVTVWDTTACKGQVAVIALQQHDGYLYGLPNEGFFSGMKLLGYVDLPIAAPTRINASHDFGLYMAFSSKEAEAELAAQAGRDRWKDSVDVQHTAAKSGFALVASRDEDKVVVLDLEPLFQSYRSMYMTTQAKYDQTKNVGPAPEQWPFAFSVATDAVPVVVEVIDVKKPASVVAGYPIGDRSFTDIDFAKKAYVATVDGVLMAYDVGGLGVEGPASKLLPLGNTTICKNPTRVYYSASGQSRDGLVFACRGDRSIHFVDGGGAKQKTLEDSRLADPVAVAIGNARGAGTISVADFEGQQVLNYLDGPIDAWGDQIFGGLGEDGKASFEFTGALKLDGKAFSVSSAQVP